MTSNNQCVIVLGMHRSGTSALTAVINFLGITAGNKLQPAVAEVNAKGFWEHTDIVALNDKLLEALGSAWHDERPLPNKWWLSHELSGFRQEIALILRRDFANASIWLIKDPRICRLMPLWYEVFNDLACQPKFILVLRHPCEVARSLLKRDGLPPELACLLWLNHVLEAEYQTRDQKRVFVSYDKLMIDWQQTLTDVGKELDIVWPVPIDVASSTISAFLDPALRHYINDAKLPGHLACLLAQKGFDLLSVPHPDPSSLDQLRAQVLELIDTISPWSIRLRFLDRANIAKSSNLEILTHQNNDLINEVKRLKATISWRMTKPIRTIWNIIHLSKLRPTAKK